MSEEPRITNLPTGETRNEMSKLGIDEKTMSPFRLYEWLKSFPLEDRDKISILFACTGGQERSRRFAELARKMGFSVASILDPKSYHKQFAVPIDEMIDHNEEKDPSYNATFPDGNIKFSNIDKPIKYFVVFTNEKIDQNGKIEIHDRYTGKIIEAVSTELLKASERTNSKPHGVAVIRVPAMESEVKLVEQFYLADQLMQM